jgi:heme oxygenase
MIKVQGLADRLRRDTEQSHRDVEQARLLKAIFAPDFAMNDYRDLICRWQHFFRALEPELTAIEVGDYRYRSRLPALSRDMAALTAEASQEAPSPAGDGWRPSSYETAVGACYVIEGSCLGARLICRRLHERFGPAVSPATHFYGMEFKQWPWFRRQLDRVGERSDIDAAEIISGARACFRAIESHMG